MMTGKSASNGNIKKLTKTTKQNWDAKTKNTALSQEQKKAVTYSKYLAVNKKMNKENTAPSPLATM